MKGLTALIILVSTGSVKFQTHFTVHEMQNFKKNSRPKARIEYRISNIGISYQIICWNCCSRQTSICVLSRRSPSPNHDIGCHSCTCTHSPDIYRARRKIHSDILLNQHFLPSIGTIILAASSHRVSPTTTECAVLVCKYTWFYLTTDCITLGYIAIYLLWSKLMRNLSDMRPVLAFIAHTPGWVAYCVGLRAGHGWTWVNTMHSRYTAKTTNYLRCPCNFFDVIVSP